MKLNREIWVLSYPRSIYLFTRDKAAVWVRLSLVIEAQLLDSVTQ